MSQNAADPDDYSRDQLYKLGYFDARPTEHSIGTPGPRLFHTQKAHYAIFTAGPSLWLSTSLLRLSLPP